MRNILLVLLSSTAFLMSCSDTQAELGSDDLTSAEVTVSAPAKAKLSGNLVKDYAAATEDITNAMLLFYTRLSPEVAAMVEPVSLTDEDVATIKCTVDKARNAKGTGNIRETIKKSNEFVRYAKATPSLTMKTMETDAKWLEFMAFGAKPENQKLVDFGKECGLMEMSISLNRRSGLYEALKLLPQY